MAKSGQRRCLEARATKVLLKRQPQRKLHVAGILRAGNFAKGFESAAGGRAEQSAGPDRRVEVGMIEEIKNVQPELESSPFANREFLLKSGVEIVQTRSNHNVAPGVSVGERRGHRKAGLVEPFRRRFRAAVRIADEI